MIDYEKLKKAPYLSKRMYIIKKLCESKGLSVEYLFGLFSYYNKKNQGRWFWQKASFSGALKDSYDKFNKSIDVTVKNLNKRDENYLNGEIENLTGELEDLLVKMETNLNLNRETDRNLIESQIDINLKSIIDDGLKGLD